jgi:hypothetical protein
MVMRITERQGKIMFLNQGLVDLYLYLPKGPLVEACHESNIAYTHALKMVKYWVSMDLVISNKSGQQYNFFYTPRGNKLASELIKMRVYLKKAGIQWVEFNEED